MAPRILVADDDAWILRMVTTVLEKRGYTVDTAIDGQMAFDKAVATTPDLVITDVMMPGMDGWTLVKQLRARPEFAFVPVIFLTALGSDDDRIRGFRLGADDYLPKPFRFEELDLRVAKTLKYRERVEAHTMNAIGSDPASTAPDPGDSSSAGIGGSLKQVGLSALLTLMEMETKTGVLVLYDDESSATGKVHLHRGRVVRANLEGQATPTNAECIYHMLTWTQGRFEFDDDNDVDPNDEVGHSTTHLLLEGARRLDTMHR